MSGPIKRRQFFRLTGAAVAGVTAVHLVEATQASAGATPEVIGGTVETLEGNVLTLHAEGHSQTIGLSRLTTSAIINRHGERGLQGIRVDDDLAVVLGAQGLASEIHPSASYIDGHILERSDTVLLTSGGAVELDQQSQVRRRSLNGTRSPLASLRRGDHVLINAVRLPGTKRVVARAIAVLDAS